jgi:hypothetical protein
MHITTNAVLKSLVVQRDPFGDFFGEDPFDDSFFGGQPRGRSRNHGVTFLLLCFVL